jgi:hypothetical protein
MQKELDAAPGAADSVPIAILGVNESGYQSGNESMCAGRSIPWLQDTPQEDVWFGKWKPSLDDVVVLDAENRKLAVYGLASHSLADPANYNYLKNLLRQAAAAGRVR